MIQIMIMCNGTGKITLEWSNEKLSPSELGEISGLIHELSADYIEGVNASKPSQNITTMKQKT